MRTSPPRIFTNNDTIVILIQHSIKSINQLLVIRTRSKYTIMDYYYTFIIFRIKTAFPKHY